MGTCHRIMVRTCNGLELRDQDSADQLLHSNDVFPARYEYNLVQRVFMLVTNCICYIS